MLVIDTPSSLAVSKLPYTVSESQRLPQLTSSTPLGTAEAQATTIAVTHLARGVTTGHPQQKVSELLTAQLAQQTGKTLERYLNRWGQVQVKLGTNPRRFSLDSSQITALFPLWRQQTLPEQRLLFTQLGLDYQRHKKNTTVNLGIGQRHLLSEAWLLGYNLFYDILLPHRHQRLGLGAEARRDYLSLAVNGYYPMSQWKSEKQSDHSVARPARGVDMIAEAYLPQHPQLGVKVHAERYFDDQIGAFTTPHAKQRVASVALGLHYTPVPLFKLSYDYTFGQRAANRCQQQVALTVDYQLGIPLAQQLESTQVAQQRSLIGSLLAPVQRNNQILLAYKEKTVQLQLPGEEELGNIGTILTIPLIIQGDLSSYTLTFAGSLATAAQANANSSSLRVQLPQAVGRHTLQVIATNQQGKQVSSNELIIQVVNVPARVLQAAKDLRQLGSWNNRAGDLVGMLVVQAPIWPRNLTLRIEHGAGNPGIFNPGHQEVTIRRRGDHYQTLKNGLWIDAPAYSGGGNCFYDVILAILQEQGTPANVTVSELRKMMAQVLLDDPAMHAFINY